jgi:hypothetical protein
MVGNLAVINEKIELKNRISDFSQKKFDIFWFLCFCSPSHRKVRVQRGLLLWEFGIWNAQTVRFQKFNNKFSFH